MKKIFYLLIIVVVTVCLYSYYMGTKGLEVNEYFIASEKLSSGFDGFKIGHFSDTLINEKTNFDELNNMVDTLNSQNNDIVVFTGDLLKSNNVDEDGLIDIFKNINPSINKYAILGDNDTSKSSEILEKSNFILVDDTCENIFYKDINPIVICGNNKNTSENTEYSYYINLIHKPDDFASSSADLTLAGHSLGGLIRLPYFGALIKKNGAEIYLDNKYVHDGKVMFVSFGIGTENIPFRFLNKPSINVYRLMSK